MIVFLFVCFWKWDLKVTWLSSGTYQSLFHKGLKFPYDGKYKSALNVCVVSKPDFCDLSQYILLVACLNLNHFEKLWIQNSEIKTLKNIILPEWAIQKFTFYCCSIFQEKKKSLAEWGMFHCIKICVRFSRTSCAFAIQGCFAM